ncbi:CHAT domain-containing protein [Chryseosolibacter histidini]|nr:CHAT domain-containing tetratricopeptide repeat protein [Chryseosolibacter histidini]
MHKDMLRCRVLYAKVNALFDDNFNFTSGPMMQMLTEIMDITMRYPGADTLLSDLYGKMAICYQDLGKDEDAVASLRKAKALRKNKKPDRSLFNIYLTLGNLFMKSYAYDSAEYHFTYIEDRLAQFRGLRKNELHRLWNELGVLHYNYGDHKLALNYYQQALQNGLSVFPPQAEQIVMVQNNIIAVLLRLDRPHEAIRKYHTLISYGNTLPILFHNLGKTYQRVEKYDSALLYLKKAESLASDDVLKIKLFNNLAITYIGLKDYDQALRCLDNAILLNRRFYKTKNAALAYSYMNKARICEQQHKIIEALKEYQAAIRVLHFDFNDSSFYTAPDDLNNVVSRPYFFECLHNKAIALRKLYETSPQHQHLQASFIHYEKAAKMMDLIRKSYSSEEAKLLFSNHTHMVYEEAIATAFELYEHTKEERYKETAFAFSEKAKMTVLSEALGALKLKKLPGLPTDLISEQAQYKRNIGRLLVRLGDTRDSAVSLKIRSDLAASEIALSKIEDQLEKNKRYRNLKYDRKPLGISEIRLRLQKNEALIEYYLAQHDAFIFTLTADDFTLHRVPLSSSFFDSFEKLKASLYAAGEGVAYRGASPSYTVYKHLVEPVSGLINDKKNWIVVPDGMLSYIPIEALVSDTAASRFVIEEHAVRYTYSSLFLPAADETSSDGSILAFAPFDHVKKMPDIHPLKGSGKEIGALQGTLYYNEAATKTAFLQQANAFDVIHLATHAETFSEDPLRSFISFYPGLQQAYDSKLYMPEIYALDLDKTKMIVISACEAGSGKLMNGEGLISLSRAFAFAGCPSIVTSLWKADDELTATLMISFYRNLKKGYTKDEALRNAKLEFLHAGQDHRLRSPVFWANFICIGDASALYNDSTIYTISAIVALILLLVMVFLKVKKKHRPVPAFSEEELN